MGTLDRTQLRQRLIESINMNSLAESIITKNQKINTEWKMISATERMRVEIRYDDDCGNGHNSFAITAEIEQKRGTRFYECAGGCLHDDILKHFPEYAHLIKWHLTSSDGPMHYIANTCYHASSRDHYGKLKGEPTSFDHKLKFTGIPFTFKLPTKFLVWLKEQPKLPVFVIESVPHENKPGDNYKFADKHTFQGYAVPWHQCPFDSLKEATEFQQAFEHYPFEIISVATAFSEGKERDLDAARHCAVWPKATDVELMSDNLKEKLALRLPKLLEDFRKDMESLGFVY